MTAEQGCMEDGDVYKWYANYAKDGNGATDGTDICFNNLNEKYISDTSDPNYQRDLPYSPHYICYNAGDSGSTGVLNTASF